MTWNHRILRYPGGGVEEGSDYFEIHEVFYREDGKVAGYSDATIGGDSWEELAAAAGQLVTAFGQPVLDESDCKHGFGNKWLTADEVADDMLHQADPEIMVATEGDKRGLRKLQDKARESQRGNDA